MKKETTVKAHTRKGKNGKIVNVRQHTTHYESAEDMVKDAIKNKKGAGKELASKKGIDDWRYVVIPRHLKGELYKENLDGTSVGMITYEGHTKNGSADTEGTKRKILAMAKLDADKFKKHGYKVEVVDATKDSYSGDGLSKVRILGFPKKSSAKKSTYSILAKKNPNEVTYSIPSSWRKGLKLSAIRSEYRFRPSVTNMSDADVVKEYKQVNREYAKDKRDGVITGSYGRLQKLSKAYWAIKEGRKRRTTKPGLSAK